MANIGFSTQCLGMSSMPLEERIKFYYSLGNNAIELSFRKEVQLNEFVLTPEIVRNIKKFDYISVHAPWREVIYKHDKKTDEIIKKLRELCRKIPVQGIVLHPDVVDDFIHMENSGLPFLFENMDTRKKIGMYPEHFTKLIKDHSFGFVLDVQHAYDTDPTMKLARKFISVFGDRLKQMHVAGRTESLRHFPVHISDNKDAIVEILKLGIDVPKILEGLLLENISQTVSRELDFVKKYEKNKTLKE